MLGGLLPTHSHHQVCILLPELPQGWAEAVPGLLQHKGEQGLSVCVETGTGTPCLQSLAVQHSPSAPAVPTGVGLSLSLRDFVLLGI